MTDRQRADAHRPPVHRSVRARFAVATAGLLVGMGGLMLALVYVLMRYVPSYDITHTTTAAATTLTPGATPIERPRLDHKPGAATWLVFIALLVAGLGYTAWSIATDYVGSGEQSTACWPLTWGSPVRFMKSAEQLIVNG